MSGEIRLKEVMVARKEFELNVPEIVFGAGEKIALMGENGSGKSTLMHVAAGLIDGGYVEVDGEDLIKLDYVKRAEKLAFLPQNPDISFPFTVFEVVRFGRFAKTGGAYTEKDMEISEKIMHELDIYRLKDRKFSELSGGEKRRAMLARALNQDASVIMLDEPVSMLDIRHSLSILGGLKDRTETVIASIHDINMAVQFFDRLILLKNGKVAYDINKKDFSSKIIKEVFGVETVNGYDTYSFSL